MEYEFCETVVRWLEDREILGGSSLNSKYKRSVLLTLLVYLRFIALGLRPQTPYGCAAYGGVEY